MAYKLADAINDAYNRRWAMINTFTVEIHLPWYLRGKVGSFDEDINLNIVSVTTPDFTNDPIEVFVANRWVIQNGKDSLYRFTITFRDHNQMSLYKKFMRIYNLTKENYFDDIKMNIVINKDPDWANESDKKIMHFWGVLVEGVSNLAFSNDTENQIAEFTVSLKCNNPVV